MQAGLRYCNQNAGPSQELQVPMNGFMLTGWSNFFTLTGAAGATLLGLLFIVVTLGTDLSTSRKLDVARASMTPALYSFTGVLLQSMVVLVPWQSCLPSGVIFVVGGGLSALYIESMQSVCAVGSILGPFRGRSTGSSTTRFRSPPASS